MTEVALLSNGRYSVLLSPAGGGYSAFDGYALTRWAPDPTCDSEGFFAYIRDLESGVCWSAALQPLGRSAERHDVSFAAGRALFSREDHDVETRTEICVAPAADLELRRIALTNRGGRPRRLDLTTYAEVVLTTPAAEAGHPAFSKLFVQTGVLDELEGLLAWRRPRSPDDQPLWLAHALLLDRADASDGSLEWETDRSKFLGRGRGVANPRAIRDEGPLSGTVGNVLDPVFSLRRGIRLEPGETVELTAVLASGLSRAEVEDSLRQVSGAGAAASAFRNAAPAPPGAERTLGLPASWLEAIRLLADPEHAPPAMSSVAPESTGQDAFARSPRDFASSRLRSDAEPAEDLSFFNGYGGFSPDGSEYVIRLEHRHDGLKWPPLPWINVIANEEIGFLASESGAGHTWCLNSRENRITPWSNDPISDPHGEALYLRDEQAGVFWSPLPGPAPALVSYEVRHGFGYTLYRHVSHDLEQEVCLFVPRSDPVKIARLRLTNAGDRRRQLSLFSYAQWVLGSAPADTRGDVRTEWDAASGAVFARNPTRNELADRVAFAAVLGSTPGGDPEFTTDRSEFLGRYGTTSEPAALRSDAAFSGGVDGSVDPCAAFRIAIELAPGETVECAVLLGEAYSAEAAREVIGRYRSSTAINHALDEVKGFWKSIVGAVQVRTPSPALDLMINGWLTYQNLSCRVWARSAFYQSGGAFGFRDQLQDSSALLYVQPALTRGQILLHAGHQFVEGDVMHWWHPTRSKGIRTRFSDDLLWLPYITEFYLNATGDDELLDEVVHFLTAPGLEPGEDEVLLVPDRSNESGSVYEHCCRALDLSLTRGSHDLPLMGVGDWNDGMNRVGRAGRGESVWLGFFLFGLLADWLPICERRGDVDRAYRYREYLAALGEALNSDGIGWDGAWYRRAYYDDGAPLGSAQNVECRIDMIAQAWAVLSGAASVERAEQALDAMEEHLVSEPERIMRLLTPPFDSTPRDPGYIKGYLPGVRENGGQYTHGALWGVRALAAIGRRDRAARLLTMLSPVSHTRTPGEVATYQAEPYVIAADVYGAEPHVGRGGWTWYTGSAGWMFRVTIESILGLELRGGRSLALRPCIPDDWAGFQLYYRLPTGSTAYRIELTRLTGENQRSEATLDGLTLRIEDGAVIVPLANDGVEHRVEVMLGGDVGPRYSPRSPNIEPLERMTSA